MPWFRVDDAFAMSPKAIAAGNAAAGLWVRAGSWCMQQLTDGHVPDAIALMLGRRADANRLVSSKLWDRVEGGYQFRNWDKYQPSKEQIENDRAGAAERQRRARQKAAEKAAAAAREAESRRDSPASDTVSHGPPSPAQPSPAAAAAEGTPLPPAVEILKGKLDARRLSVRWDQVGADRLAVIEHLIEVHGDDALVKSAIEQWRPESPAQFAQAWLGKWQSLVPPGTPLHVVRTTPRFCPTHDWVQLDQAGVCRSCAAEKKAR